LQKIWKNKFLKYKINDVVLSVKKIYFEGHILHIIHLLKEEKVIPRLHQKLSEMSYLKTIAIKGTEMYKLLLAEKEKEKENIMAVEDSA
jgi:hypothetical protein